MMNDLMMTRATVKLSTCPVCRTSLQAWIEMVDCVPKNVNEDANPPDVVKSGKLTDE